MMAENDIYKRWFEQLDPKLQAIAAEEGTYTSAADKINALAGKYPQDYTMYGTPTPQDTPQVTPQVAGTSFKPYRGDPMLDIGQTRRTPEEQAKLDALLPTLRKRYAERLDVPYVEGQSMFKTKQDSLTPEDKTNRKALLATILGGVADLGEMGVFAKGGPTEGVRGKDKYSQRIQALRDKLLGPSISQTSSAGLMDPATLRKEYTGNKIIQETDKVKSAISRMTGPWEAYLKNPNQSSLNALDQVLVVTFNKMIDPGSVVRESEFARTAEGMALLKQLEGLKDKIKKGGGGLTFDERKSIVNTAKQMLEGQMKMANSIRDFYAREATLSGVDPTRVIMGWGSEMPEYLRTPEGKATGTTETPKPLTDEEDKKLTEAENKYLQ